MSFISSNIFRFFVGFWVFLLISIVFGDYYLNSIGYDFWSNPFFQALGIAVDVDDDRGPFCETKRAKNAGIMRETSNALSDFSFLAVGFVALAHACYMFEKNRKEKTDNRRSVLPSLYQRVPVITLYFGVINILHAFGTWFNHSCRCHIGHILDVFFMWSAVWSITAFELVRAFEYWTVARALSRKSSSLTASSTSRSRSPKTVSNSTLALLFFVLVSVMFFVFEYFAHGHYPASYDGAEKGLMVPIIISNGPAELIARRAKATIEGSKKQITTSSSSKSILSDPFVLGLLFVVFGVLAGQLDVLGVWCNPESLFQWHAIWHLCGASAIINMYRHHLVPLQLQVDHQAP